MSTQFLGEIRIVAFTFAPHGWTQCNGQLLPINQNQALFALFGTTYGGNGQTTFALPDLRGCTTVHTDNSATGSSTGFALGFAAGENAHTVTIAELPTHTHQVTAVAGAATTPVPTANRFAVQDNLYAPAVDLVSLAPASVATVGGNQPHENRQPFLALTYCVSLQGIFPSQT